MDVVVRKILQTNFKRVLNRYTCVFVYNIENKYLSILITTCIQTAFGYCMAIVVMHL